MRLPVKTPPKRLIHVTAYPFLKVLFGKLRREEDKHLHMIWSFGLMLAAQLFWPAIWAFVVVFCIGLVKECWDSRFGSGFCIFDIFANVFGIVGALVLPFSFAVGPFLA